MLLLGNLEAPTSTLSDNAFIVERIAQSLNLSTLGNQFSAEEVVLLLGEQYTAAEEFVYGHPIWRKIREGDQAALHAYILETRHYLAAAASRMCPSVSPGLGLSPLTLMLSRHALEEWDHAQFFNQALDLIGCSSDMVRLARPLPATLEWIHLSRHIAAMGELVSAACSGFMEHSSVEKDAVLGWHDLLVRHGLLSRTATEKVLGHFSTDLQYGHSNNWKRAVRTQDCHPGPVVANLLNAVCSLSEMIYRWLSALEQGCASAIVTAAQVVSEEGLDPLLRDFDSPLEVGIFQGLPVWPSSVMSLVNGERNGDDNPSDIVVATCYALGQRVPKLATGGAPFATLVGQIHQQLCGAQHSCADRVADIEQMTTDWLVSVDGHGLWQQMIDGCTDELVIGYMLENFHYLASATRHVSPAIAACLDARIRENLLQHLQDELTHCDILKPRLRELGVKRPEAMRPLPTTAAFVGYLSDLARHDWKGYLIGSTFLQKSLSECRGDDRHLRFYSRVSANNPRCAALLGAMAAHDELDDELGHDQRPSRNIQYLLARGEVGRDSVARAAILPSLAWSFLDGIRAHYCTGRDSVLQRQAWSAK
ncbi:hypothetical protein J4P02_12955 [Pseudomonas sp. NFXW11]|uniref:hypothetical protein n=1 Tax=Pseudomonas sp. NFXW11 TaxID=2819531 RepID=UPI003CEFFE5E